MTEDILEQLRRTDLTPAEMLRAMGEAGNEILRLRGDLEDAEHHADLRLMEIERLRAENETLRRLFLSPYAFRYDRQRQQWRSANLAMASSHSDETEQVMVTEIDRLRTAGAALYALLDEMHKCGRREPGLTEALEGWDAVVAAAKEDDRG